MATATPRLGFDTANPLAGLGQPATAAPTGGNTESVTHQALGAANTSLQTGGKLLGASGQSLDAVIASLMKLVSGDRTAMMQEAAPEINAIAEQYDSARKAISATSPRGGGRNAVMAEGRYKEAGAISDLLGATRKGARTELGNLGLGLAGLGINAQGQGQQSLAAVLQALIGKDAAKDQMWAGIAGSAGEALGGIIGSMILGPGGML